jgi:esterase/lipase
MDEMTIHAYADYFKWITIWTPVFVVTTINAIWMWWLLANDLEISTLHIALSAVSLGGVFTAVFANKLVQDWVYNWSIQIAYAKDDIMLEVMLVRMNEINSTVDKAVKGNILLSAEELQLMMSETAAITYVSDQVTKRQVQQLEILKKISAKQDTTQ